MQTHAPTYVLCRRTDTCRRTPAHTHAEAHMHSQVGTGLFLLLSLANFGDWVHSSVLLGIAGVLIFSLSCAPPSFAGSA